MSVERIVPTDDLAAGGPVQSLRINRLMTDGVVEAPHGAHFTECVPDYPRDEEFQQRVRRQREVARGVGGVEDEVPRLRRPRRVSEGDRPMNALGCTCGGPGPYSGAEVDGEGGR